VIRTCVTDRWLLRASVGISIVAATARLHAQASPTQSTTAQITARVYAPLTITRNEDLRFGNLYSPFPAKAIAFTDNAASGGRARFTLSGEGAAELSLVVNVPSAVTSGSSSLPVGSFVLRTNTTDADGSGTDTSLSTGDNTLTANLSGSAGASGNLYLRVRATATPGGTQAAGVYTGTITVTVNYTGA